MRLKGILGFVGGIFGFVGKQLIELYPLVPDCKGIGQTGA